MGWSPTASGRKDTVREPSVSGAQAGGWRPPQTWNEERWLCPHPSPYTRLGMVMPILSPALPKSLRHRLPWGN